MEAITMAKRNNRYKQMELRMTCVLLADLFLFIVYLFSAGFGVIWLKVITAIFAILLPVLCLTLLYLTKELLKQRSLLMTTGFFGIFLCTVVSLIANFPSPVA